MILGPWDVRIVSGGHFRLDGVATQAEATWYAGKRLAYVYKAKTAKRGTNFRVVWGRVTRPHGSAGAVRAKFRKNLPPSALLLEITGSGLLTGEKREKAALDPLRARGISVSFGDFVPAASPDLISRIRPASLKLHGPVPARQSQAREFTRAIAATVEHAHRHNCKVVFERIEESSQLDFARQVGCDLFQGFLIAPPLEPEDATQFLASRAEAALLP